MRIPSVIRPVHATLCILLATGCVGDDSGTNHSPEDVSIVDAESDLQFPTDLGFEDATGDQGDAGAADAQDGLDEGHADSGDGADGAEDLSESDADLDLRDDATEDVGDTGDSGDSGSEDADTGDSGGDLVTCPEADCPPSVRITQPGDGSLLHGTVMIRAQASDDVGVTKVSFFVDSGLLLADTAVPFQAEWPTGEFTEGSHVLAAVATDTNGATARHEITVSIDRTPPTVVITTPEAGDRLDGRVPVVAEVSDDVAVAQAKLWMNHAEESAIALTGPPWEWTIDTGVFRSGAHRIHVQASDTSGLTATASVDVIVDRPPTVSFVNPEAGETVAGDVLVHVDAVDDLGEPEVDFYVNGTLEGEFDSDGLYLWTPEFAAGERRLRAVATDSGGQAGNAEITVNVNHDFDLVAGWCPPVGHCTQLVDGVVLSGAGVVTVSGTDDSGAVTSVDLEIDGTTIGSDDSVDFAIELDTTDFADGEHTLTITAHTDTDEGELVWTVIFSNCGCNDFFDVCDAGDDDGACGCDPACDDSEPCSEDGVCDDKCGADPDCDCDGIPVTVEQGQFCLDGVNCLDGRCLADVVNPFGSCHQLCSPGTCDELCGDGQDCEQQYHGDAPERFEDGRLLGVCRGVASDSAYQPCESSTECDGGLCVQSTISEIAQCLPPCVGFPFETCPVVEGFAGSCAYQTDGGQRYCLLTCNPDTDDIQCPSGMICNPRASGGGFCDWGT